MERRSDELFKETKTEILQPNRQRQKSLKYSGAEDQTPWTVVEPEKERGGRGEGEEEEE